MLAGRKTHPADLLNKWSFAVLAVGDSNLLLDRQTTTAKDCNKSGQVLDARLEELGASRFYRRGEADERTGMQEVEPWIEGLWSALAKAGETGGGEGGVDDGGADIDDVDVSKLTVSDS